MISGVKMDSTVPYGKELIIILISYVLGCFSTGYYLVRLRTGQDLRRLGSGSTGGTNAGRVLGKSGFIITMLGDMLKGAIAVWIAIYFGAGSWAMGFVIFAAVAGHIFPVQLGFHGGKGLATALGALLVFDFRLALVIAALAGLLGLLSRQLMLSMMFVILVSPFITIWMGYAFLLVLGLALTAFIILVAHRENLVLSLKNIRVWT